MLPAIKGGVLSRQKTVRSLVAQSSLVPTTFETENYERLEGWPGRRFWVSMVLG